MIFTTAFTRVGQTASDLFRERGNSTDVPCSVADSRIFAQVGQSTMADSCANAHLEYLVSGALNVGIKQDITEPPVSVKDKLVDFTSPFLAPQIGVSYGPSNQKDDVVEKMQDLGFVKISFGRNSYYVGASSKAQNVQRPTRKTSWTSFRGI